MPAAVGFINLDPPRPKKLGRLLSCCWTQGVRTSISFATRKDKQGPAGSRQFSDRPSKAFPAFPAYDYAYGLYALFTMFLCDACPTKGC